MTLPWNFFHPEVQEDKDEENIKILNQYEIEANILNERISEQRDKIIRFYENVKDDEYLNEYLKDFKDLEIQIHLVNIENEMITKKVEDINDFNDIDEITQHNLKQDLIEFINDLDNLNQELQNEIDLETQYYEKENEIFEESSTIGEAIEAKMPEEKVEEKNYLESLRERRKNLEIVNDQLVQTTNYILEGVANMSFDKGVDSYFRNQETNYDSLQDMIALCISTAQKDDPSFEVTEKHPPHIIDFLLSCGVLEVNVNNSKYVNVVTAFK